MPYDLTGRTAVITGASEGLGLAIAQAYVQAGASVVVCARSESKLAIATEELRRAAQLGQQVVPVVADVSKQSDVDKLAGAALERFSRIHVLVNNAGVYGPKGPIEAVDWEDWVRAVEINLFGSILMCRALIPHFKKHRYGKIVQLSGGGATNPLPRISAYAASKAAIVRFAETLAGELIEDGVDVNCIAPGALNTRLLDEVLDAGPDVVGKGFYDRSVKQKNDGGTSLRLGAELAVFLGSADSDGITGRLLSAVWDPWKTLSQRTGELKGSDVYTLRRIVPKDRGLDWEE